MFDLVFALLGIFGILVGTLMWQFEGDVKKIVAYFKKEVGILWGIIVFTGSFIIIALLTLLLSSKAEANGFKELKYFQYAEVYIGMDYTKKLSPQCYKGEYSDRLTSNGGVRMNLIQTSSKRVEVNTYYLHKSCAYNRDREGIDAGGVELVWKLWQRN